MVYDPIAVFLGGVLVGALGAVSCYLSVRLLADRDPDR